MAVEARNRGVEELVIDQRKAISNFFGTEVPAPPDRLFVVCDKIRKEKLWTPEIHYIPDRRLSEGSSFPGLEHPFGSALYRWMRDGLIDADGDLLPGQWIIWDPTRRPDYNNGKQMYPDTPRFREILAGLRDGEDGIEVPSDYKHVPKDSRFAISADEIDGSRNLVGGEIAKIMALQEGEVISTPPNAVFVYIGNLRHQELGRVTTSEWFRNNFGHGGRLDGGGSRLGGLSDVDDWPSGFRNRSVGFRLQVSFPSRA